MHVCLALSAKRPTESGPIVLGKGSGLGKTTSSDYWWTDVNYSLQMEDADMVVQHFYW